MSVNWEKYINIHKHKRPYVYVWYTHTHTERHAYTKVHLCTDTEPWKPTNVLRLFLLAREGPHHLCSTKFLYLSYNKLDSASARWVFRFCYVESRARGNGCFYIGLWNQFYKVYCKEKTKVAMAYKRSLITKKKRQFQEGCNIYVPYIFCRVLKYKT